MNFASTNNSTHFKGITSADLKTPKQKEKIRGAKPRLTRNTSAIKHQWCENVENEYLGFSYRSLSTIIRNKVRCDTMQF